MKEARKDCPLVDEAFKGQLFGYLAESQKSFELRAERTDKALRLAQAALAAAASIAVGKGGTL